MWERALDAVEKSSENSPTREWLRQYIADQVREEHWLSQPDHAILAIYKYAFKEEAIKDKHLFKCPEMKDLEVYVSAAFKRLVEDNQLVGLAFRPIYPPAD